MRIMDAEERRNLLDAVARGEVTPDDAAERLGGEPDPRPGPVAVDDGPIRSLRIRVTAGAVKIIGDPSIAGAEVAGEHDSVSQELDGDTLVVDVTPLHGVLGERRRAQFRVRGGRGGRIRVHRMMDGRTFETVTIRVNPDLPLELAVTAGSLSASGLRAPLSCDLDAGALNVRDARGPVDARVTAGSMSYSGVLDHGESRFKCDAGALTITLDPGSSVKGAARVELGKLDIQLPKRDDGETFMLGDGAGTLSIDATMSAVSVHT
jgi:hypothetical protein